VLISGGGIVGPALAFWLHHHGHQPLVVERSPKVRDGGYMIDFIGPGYDASETMGRLPEIEAIHCQIPTPQARLAVWGAAMRMSAKPFVSLLLGRRFAWADTVKS
jgi:2-polyprenyl-6-methoxyphenol hydroxylase-like FAD-dependent oxidoreductase